MSSNLHRNSTEANKHTPKGFDLATNNSALIRDERGQSRYIPNLLNERAENLVDGNSAPPTTTEGHVYVLTGSGTVHVDWQGADFNDIVRVQGGVWVAKTPVNGDLIYNKTDSKWYLFNTTWSAFVTPPNWGSIGGTLSDQTDLQSALDAKQDTLVSGTNIKTINSESLLGSGNITINSQNLATNDLTQVDATRTYEMGTGSRILRFLSNTDEKIVFNTASGSPTLQANKSGNGAAIRANKTSGSGSAFEVSGGTSDFGNNKLINVADPTNPQDAMTLAYFNANIYGGKRYTLIKPNGTKEFYDTLTQVASNWADNDTLHQFANETLSVAHASTVSGFSCWRELPAINWNGNGHSILFNVLGTSAFAVNANKNINLYDLKLTYNCVDNSSSNGLIKSPNTSLLNGNGGTTLSQNVTASNANHLTAFGLIGNFDNFNISSLHDKTWQVPSFCNGIFINCNIRNVFTNRAATFIDCNFNDFVANIFSSTNIIFENCTLTNSVDPLLSSNQGTVTITNCNMRFNVNSGIIMNATVLMNNSTINNVGNGLMFASYSGSNNILKTTGNGGFLNTALFATDYGSIFESTGGWNCRFTGSGSMFECTKFINNGTGSSLNIDVSGTGLKASFVDCIFFCGGTNNVGAVSNTYSFIGCTFNRTNFAFMYSGTQQQLLDNDPNRLTNVIDSRGNKGHGCRSPYPAMTTTERNGLTGLSKGFTIENTTTNFLQVYNGSTWKDLLDLT